MVSSTSVAIFGARFAVGSSNIMALGFLIMAIVIATICLSPPLRLATLVPMYSDNRGKIPNASRSLVDRKSTRLNSSHDQISYAVFCLKKKKDTLLHRTDSRPQRSRLSIYHESP